MKTRDIVWFIVIGVATTVVGALVYDAIKEARRSPLRVLSFPPTAA
jgi:hypothetical protein